MFRPIRIDHTNCLQVAIQSIQKKKKEALQIFVNSVMAQVPKLYPDDGPNMWGEPYVSVPSSRVPVTQTGFEELTKAFLMLLSTVNSGRLNGYVTNHLLAKQHADDRAVKMAEETAASALALAKAQED